MTHHPDLNVWRIDSLIRHETPGSAARRAGDRLLNLAAGLPINTTVEVRTVATGTGSVALTVASAADLTDELAWVFEGIARVSPADRRPSGTGPVAISELVPAAGAAAPDPFDFALPEGEPKRGLPWYWPVAVIDDPLSLLQAMRGARVEVRLHLAPCHDLELAQLPHRLNVGTQPDDLTRAVAYLGTPVEARLLVGHDAAPPAQGSCRPPCAGPGRRAHPAGHPVPRDGGRVGGHPGVPHRARGPVRARALPDVASRGRDGHRHLWAAHRPAGGPHGAPR